MIYNEKEYKAKIPYDKIDAEIRDIIRDFNKWEKITTRESCAGHIRKEKFLNPYITLIFDEYELLREFLMRFVLLSKDDAHKIGVGSWVNGWNRSEGSYTISIYTTFSEGLIHGYWWEKKFLKKQRDLFFSRIDIALATTACGNNLKEMRDSIE